MIGEISKIKCGTIGYCKASAYLSVLVNYYGMIVGCISYNDHGIAIRYAGTARSTNCGCRPCICVIPIRVFSRTVTNRNGGKCSGLTSSVFAISRISSVISSHIGSIIYEHGIVNHRPGMGSTASVYSRDIVVVRATDKVIGGWAIGEIMNNRTCRNSCKAY